MSPNSESEPPCSSNELVRMRHSRGRNILRLVDDQVPDPLTNRAGVERQGNRGKASADSGPALRSRASWGDLEAQPGSRRQRSRILLACFMASTTRRIRCSMRPDVGRSAIDLTKWSIVLPRAQDDSIRPMVPGFRLDRSTATLRSQGRKTEDPDLGPPAPSIQR